MISVRIVSVTTTLVHGLYMSSSSKKVVIGLYAWMTQPVHGPVALAPLAFDDGTIKRVWLSLWKDLVRVIKLSDGRDVVRVSAVRDGVVVRVLDDARALLADDECEAADDAHELVGDTEFENSDEALGFNECDDDEADFESDKVTMIGDGADCALSTSRDDELEDEKAIELELSVLVSKALGARRIRMAYSLNWLASGCWTC
jgi:hypothetical protein